MKSFTHPSANEVLLFFIQGDPIQEPLSFWCPFVKEIGSKLSEVMKFQFTFRYRTTNGYIEDVQVGIHPIKVELGVVYGIFDELTERTMREEGEVGEFLKSFIQKGQQPLYTVN